jgi:hypothetical protein
MFVNLLGVDALRPDDPRTTGEGLASLAATGEALREAGKPMLDAARSMFVKFLGVEIFWPDGPGATGDGAVSRGGAENALPPAGRPRVDAARSMFVRLRGDLAPIGVLCDTLVLLEVAKQRSRTVSERSIEQLVKVEADDLVERLDRR